VATEPDGGVRVNEFLQSVTNPRVYAAGDAAAAPGSLPLTPVAGYEGAIGRLEPPEGNPGGRTTAAFRASCSRCRRSRVSALPSLKRGNSTSMSASISRTLQTGIPTVAWRDLRDVQSGHRRQSRPGLGAHLLGRTPTR